MSDAVASLRWHLVRLVPDAIRRAFPEEVCMFIHDRARVQDIIVHRCEVWERVDTPQQTLIATLYWTTDPARTHRTAEAALAAASEPIEPNEP